MCDFDASSGCALSSWGSRPRRRSAPGEKFVGTWIGTWDGAGSGGFELTIEKDKSDAIVGRVSVTGEPEYKATLMDLSFEGAKMSARYDFPPDPGGEVKLSATFDGGSAKGTWTLREKATGNDVATGNWNVTRK